MNSHTFAICDLAETVETEYRACMSNDAGHAYISNYGLFLLLSGSVQLSMITNYLGQHINESSGNLGACVVFFCTLT